MNNEKNDEELIFYPEDEDKSKNDGKDEKTAWRIIIADDDDEVHTITKMALKDLAFKGKKLDFVSTYTAEETKKLLQLKKGHDFDVILLDVVMESDNAGLKLVKYIREKLGNSTLRIILRTGQPGVAPEKDLIINYDINDYKEKTELTYQKLVTTIIASLRSYCDIMAILEKDAKLEEYSKNLEKLVEKAMAELKTLRGFVPICASCKKIRDDTGFWQQVESYVAKHTEAEFTHSICPDCIDKIYPELIGNTE